VQQGQKPHHNVAELEGIIIADVACVVFDLRKLNVKRFGEEQNVTSAGKKWQMRIEVRVRCQEE
jgi:hypothetical protein